ncbi:VanZ family protein [Lapidilactobacillus gannanensis]|uniref:VanZ family protein n=1 Tax=Lapidilactobacillus gannanensis TaxID=2486002 RepID=A0ABW4BM54_9LACO|nr:VanZ family protein [Lapidilactobacillus gannanensis]
MYLLGPLYRVVADNYQARINHFPLIKLIFYSLDKALIYFILFLILRIIYLRVKQRPWHWRREILVGFFTFYLLLLLALTVFRGIYFPWQMTIYWQRPLSVINVQPLTETIKLQYGQSIIDFVYNFYGNILWFIPFGMLQPLLQHRRPHFFSTVLLGMLLSLSIETLQFFLATGVADIDDLIFNTLGTVLGYGLYWLFLRPFFRCN